MTPILAWILSTSSDARNIPNPVIKSVKVAPPSSDSGICAIVTFYRNMHSSVPFVSLDRIVNCVWVLLASIIASHSPSFRALNVHFRFASQKFEIDQFPFRMALNCTGCRTTQHTRMPHKKHTTKLNVPILKWSSLSELVHETRNRASVHMICLWYFWFHRTLHAHTQSLAYTDQLDDAIMTNLLNLPHDS